MRIACLQFAPQVGDIDNNLNLADAILSRASPKDLDLLVLPELAFSGYNFRSLEHVTQYLEPAETGITSLWAKATALEHDCVVTVGYPEQTEFCLLPEFYNSSITINSNGETIANYRKSFLFFPDEYHALQGPDDFCGGSIERLGNVAMGSCRWPTSSFELMEKYPYKYEAPWGSTWDFASHVLHRQANLVVLTMAWFLHENTDSFSRRAQEPDMDTLSHWLERMEPLIRAGNVGEIIVVLANRTGNEGGMIYAGTSAVLGIKNGEVKVYGILGRGEKRLLVVDTDEPASAMAMPGPIPSAAVAAYNTFFSNAATEFKESDPISTGPTKPMLRHSALDDLLPVVATQDLDEAQAFGLGLGVSLNTAGDQISRLSPVPNSPDACFAPTTGRFPWSSELYDREPDSPTSCNSNQLTQVQNLPTCTSRQSNAVAEAENDMNRILSVQTLPSNNQHEVGDTSQSASLTHDTEGIENDTLHGVAKVWPPGIMTAASHDLGECRKTYIEVAESPIFGSFERFQSPKSQSPSKLSGSELQD